MADVERRLAAILAIDVVGFSRMMGADEIGTLERLKSVRADIINPLIDQHLGRVVKLIGDGMLVEFDSAVNAVQCAIDVQASLKRHNENLEEDMAMQVRMGINLGDVIIDGDDIYGDGVNVAARLESIADVGGIFISSSVCDSVQNKVSAGFDDLGDRQVKNIDHPVHVFRVNTGDPPVAAKHGGTSKPVWVMAMAAVVVIFAAIFLLKPANDIGQEAVTDAAAPAMSEKPSIAVLPFDNLSDDPSQAFFADGMTEDLITDISKVSGLFVVARNSTFVYKGQAVDIRKVAKELGVRYVLEGSVRKAGTHVRINAQLIDASTGGHLWAERYDREIKDIFALQDQVIEQIVSALKVKLTPDEETRLAHQLTTSTEAYEFWMRGREQESFFTKESNLEARALFERALELDPTFAAAMAKLATTHSLAGEFGWSPTPEKSIEKAILLAERAVALRDDLPQAHWALSRVYSRNKNFDGPKALAAIKKAIALDPNYADAYAYYADVLAMIGRAEGVAELIAKAKRLNPHFPFWYYYVEGLGQLMLNDYEAAIESFLKTIERNQTIRWPHRSLITAYGHLGKIDDAEWEMEELRGLGFEPTIENFRKSVSIQDPEYLKIYFEGFRKAGVPEQ